MYFSTTLISEKRKFSYTKCCWWDLWSNILKEEFQCVYQEANGAKSRGVPASRTLWEHKCKTNRMKTSLTQSEHMKARRRWSWVRGAQQTLGDSLWSVNETHMFVPFAHFLWFPIPSGAAVLVFYASKLQRERHRRSDRSFPPKTAEIPKVFEEESLQTRLVASRKYHRER